LSRRLGRPRGLSDSGTDPRRSEKELWREFEVARPRLLGALLDGAVQGLRKLPHIRLEKLPRMADFALWGSACETAFWPPGTFLRAYDANRRAAIDGVIQADPVATFVRELHGRAGHLGRKGLGSFGCSYQFYIRVS